MTNIVLSMLDKAGVPADTLGDSTGPLKPNRCRISSAIGALTYLPRETKDERTTGTFAAQRHKSPTKTLRRPRPRRSVDTVQRRRARRSTSGARNE